ncbi:NUDIX hydrolase [Sphingomonas sp. So64.6b]|uniref:NUDIX hydrolase n=1 Tax=Sphingomonas sp. So64.6b TaxID=2997354 RepID=UPI0016049AB3|nr:NUDIX hydrolase [Sphingomonas sp. So64.6b]QNA83436.1 NUDIX hydrolase [Sphingomonas sp. So64.6b]
MTDEFLEAIPAATLVLFRERPGGAPELLMVERAKAMVFAAGALVFPGGRIDPGDHSLATILGGDREDTAGRIAAIRETIEEVAMPIGLEPVPTAEELAALRAALHAGTSFGEALADAGLSLNPSSLVPYARWLPRHANMRIFDTRFYLARLPANAPLPEVDATENVRVLWTTAQQVLDDADAGRARIIFPTRRNLERLAQYRSFAEAVDDTIRHPIRTVTPWIEQRGGEDYLCIPHDIGYPVASETIASAMRG